MNIINSTEIEKDTYVNEITDTLNQYLTLELKDILNYFGKSVGTYLCTWPNDNNIICFRVPGATRGHIKLEDNIIISFTFYDTSEGCYEGNYISSVEKFVGSKLILEEVELNNE